MACTWVRKLGLAIAVLAGSGALSCSSQSGGSGGGSGGSSPTGSGGATANGGTPASSPVGTGGKSIASGGAGSGGGGSGSGGSGGATGSDGTTATGGARGSGGATNSGGSGSGGAGTSTATVTGGSRAGGADGGGGASNGGSGSGGTGTGTATATGGRTGGASGGGGVGTEASGGGTAADGGSGNSATGGATAAPTGGSTGRGGASGTGGAGTGGTGSGGSTDCAGRAVSLEANGTGSASDSAYANVEIDLKTDLPIGNAKRTVEFWAFIRSTDWVGEKNEVYYYGGSANAAAFGLDFGTNPVTGSTTNHATLNPITGGGFNDDSTNDLGINSSTDQWVHIAMVWDGSQLITYVNGLAKITTLGTGGVTALVTAQSVFVLGCNPTNKNCFGGSFDELRVWNVARSASEIKDNYNKPATGNEAGLVGYWKFDETSGTTAADSVTATGHTAHPGTLKADTTAHQPTFVVPSTPVPLVCP